VLEAVVEGFRSYLQRLRAGPREDESLEAFHLDVLAQLDRYRILCAHRGGVFGVSGANDAAQRALATAGLLEPVGAWWLGRPVLVTANDYSVGRYNGDVGLVVRDADGLWAVAFPEERGVTYLPPARMPEHQTVFAMTIHKSQGSEFDDVLVVLPEEPSPVLTRELVYTGITRARRRVSVLGAESVLRYGLERRVRRASGLARAFEGDATSS
jgi:exodeoxyribonuclease V alpha subunit